MKSYQYADIYAEKHLNECVGCGAEFVLKRALGEVFIKLNVYFPSEFEAMLDMLKLKEKEVTQ